MPSCIEVRYHKGYITDFVANDDKLNMINGYDPFATEISFNGLIIKFKKSIQMKIHVL